MKFTVTHEIITPESSEHGEAEYSALFAEDLTLREAIGYLDGCADQADSWPLSLNSPPRWFTRHNYEENFTTGAIENRSLHLPENITPSSALRIARLLGVD